MTNNQITVIEAQAPYRLGYSLKPQTGTHTLDVCFDGAAPVSVSQADLVLLTFAEARVIQTMRKHQSAYITVNRQTGKIKLICEGVNTPIDVTKFNKLKPVLIKQASPYDTMDWYGIRPEGK